MKLLAASAMAAGSLAGIEHAFRWSDGAFPKKASPLIFSEMPFRLEGRQGTRRPELGSAQAWPAYR
jgi:hypothetical protein